MEIFNSAIIFILGVSIGSFLNVLIDRLPQEKSILGRSQCDFCHRKLKWFDLIPIFSFLFLRARCRYCHKQLNWQYPLVEILTGLVFVFILKTVLLEDSLLIRASLLGTVSCLVVIFFSDLKYHLISDYALLALFVFSFLTKINVLQQTPELLASGLIVATPVFLIYFLSRERAMGQGDVYLSAIIGFLLGWKAGFIALYIAFVTGAIFGIIMIILRKKKLKSKVPFGPFIVTGTVTMIFFQDKIFSMIQKFYGF